MKKFIIILLGLIFTFTFANAVNQSYENDFVLLNGGTLLMGSDEDDDKENSQHKVTLTYNYYLGKHEITFEQYDLFCKETGMEEPDDKNWGRGDNPVINVRWVQAIEYCNWFSLKENLPVAYDKDGNLLDENGNQTIDITEVKGYRLPTEAEWIFAARGGNETKNYKYSGSDNLNEVAWYLENSENKIHPVGTKIPNELGIYDMSGNVWEWCTDFYEPFSNESVENPVGAEFGYDKVKRGGCWYNEASGCELSLRKMSPVGNKGGRLGFRVCRTE